MINENHLILRCESLLHLDWLLCHVGKRDLHGELYCVKELNDHVRDHFKARFSLPAWKCEHVTVALLGQSSEKGIRSLSSDNNEICSRPCLAQSHYEAPMELLNRENLLRIWFTSRELNVFETKSFCKTHPSSCCCGRSEWRTNEVFFCSEAAW